MARIGIQYEDVKYAAIYLLSQGIAPSVQKIREKLGTGSNTTIAEHLASWREDYATKEIHHLPANMPKELISAIEVLWQSAMEQATNQLAITKKSLTEQQENLQYEQQLMAQRAADFEKRIEEYQQNLENKDSQLQTLKTEYAVLQERLVLQLEEIQLLKQQHENRLKQVYDEKHTALEQTIHAQTEVKKLQQQLHEQAEKHQAALTLERHRQEESENRWLLQIDQARTELQHGRKESELNSNKKIQQVESLKEEVISLKNQSLISNTHRQNLEKNNQELKLELHQLQSQYYAVISELAALKVQKEKIKPKKSIKNEFVEA